MTPKAIDKAARQLAATLFSDTRFEEKVRSMREDTSLTKAQAKRAITILVDEFQRLANVEIINVYKDE